MKYTEKSAVISPCKQYRYRLVRVWEPNLEALVFLMLNPSTADGKKDDRTINKCMDIANRNGCGKLVVVNLFAYRATDYRRLPEVADPVGPDNDRHIQEAALEGLVVCAWGSGQKIDHLTLRNRPARVMRLLQKAGACTMHLRQCIDGHPMHPLFVSSLLPLKPYQLNRELL